MADNIRTIQSLDRAVMLLGELASEPEGLSLGELGRRVGIAVQTTQGLLRTLQKHNFVTQAGRGEPYFLGSEPHRLSQIWLSMRTPPQSVRREVSELCSELGEYVVLAEMRGLTWTPLLEYNSNHTLRVQSEDANSRVLHTMATGKILMAYMDAETREQIISQLDFAQHGPKSINSAEELREDLQNISATGFSACVEQRSTGIAAVAVPLKDSRGNRLALGVSIPLPRYSLSRRDEIVNALRATATKIEANC